jgi:hypothetical protein
MRLSALGTAGLVLTLAAAVIASAMVIPFEVGLPAMAKMSAPFALEQVAEVDASVQALEQALPTKDWAAIHKAMDRTALALDKLAMAAGAIPALMPPNERLTVDQIRQRLQAAKDLLNTAQVTHNLSRLDDGLRTFHELYDPIGKAGKQTGK